MADMQPERGEVNARILYWGAPGGGKSTNLQAIHARLRPDHRGPLEEVPTRVDPSVCYERLGIELGQIAGQRTRIQIVAVPGAPEHAVTRKQLLDRVDGIVFVVDSTPTRIDDNLASFDELRTALHAYGRRLEDVPLVVQYNKRDDADPFVLEELHRKLEVGNAAVFEAVASGGTGVLQTLTTISKRVVRALRDPHRAAPASVPPAPVDHPAPETPAPSEARTGVEPGLGTVPADPFVPPAAPADRAEEHPFSPDPDAPTTVNDASFETDTAVDTSEPDSLTARAHNMLDASWSEVGRDEVGVDGGTAWMLTDAGSAAITGPRSLSLPLVLCDSEGRELRFELKLSLEALDAE